jgi:hypothetical protein
MKKKDSRTFINELITAFPEIKDEVLDEDWIGLIHLQISCLTRYTQKAIEANDVSKALKCFEFVNSIIDQVSFKIENALVVSWVFHLTFQNNTELYKLFPIKLKELKIKFEQWEKDYVTNSNNQQLKDFLNNLGEETN